MQASFKQYLLDFKKPGGTSRGILHTKETFFLTLTQGARKGVGECGLFRGLSADDVPEYEEKLQWLCDHITMPEEELKEELRTFPSLWFGYEQASRNLKYGDDLYFPSAFTEGKQPISINGLIWMGNSDFMQEQIEEKLQQGFHCIKLKIGVHWEQEYQILKKLRARFSSSRLELRVDANGGFNFEQAKKVVEQLHQLEIHSIEQPIKTGQIDRMAALCAFTPVPIALDEELIGVFYQEEKEAILQQIKPQYLILKPSLVGGISGSDEWIGLAEKYQVGWWITSALESNIGLNAIAQYTFTKNPKIPQGLGTGGLFTNNLPSQLYLRGDELWHR